MQELEKAKASGGLSDIIYCFSQEPGMPRTYVQDGIDINADRLAALLATPNAHYYLSGDATMASSVAAVLQKAIGPEMCMRMQSEGRWHENIFGPAKTGKPDAGAATTRQRSKLKQMEWDAKARNVLLVRTLSLPPTLLLLLRPALCRQPQFHIASSHQPFRVQPRTAPLRRRQN